MRELGDCLERGDLRILPEPGVFGGDSALRHYGCGFDHGEARAALDDAAEVGEMPGGVVAVLGGVLAEGGEHDAVLEGDAADGERLEEFGDRVAIRLGGGGRSCWRLLGGSVVGYLNEIRVGIVWDGQWTYSWSGLVGDIRSGVMLTLACNTVMGRHVYGCSVFGPQVDEDNYQKKKGNGNNGLL